MRTYQSVCLQYTHKDCHSCEASGLQRIIIRRCGNKDVKALLYHNYLFNISIGEKEIFFIKLYMGKEKILGNHAVKPIARKNLVNKLQSVHMPNTFSLHL